MSLYPLEFVPILQNYLWGGQRLRETLGKPGDGQQPLAESWEVVDHPSQRSIVARGPLAGTSLHELWNRDRQAMGGRHATGETFPLLLKYLDCERVLSVQVHPDDSYAQRLSPPDLGKTEAWYIVEADPGSLIYAGLAEGVGRRELAAAVRAGETARVLHAFEPHAGDCVFIPAGTVHALGSGLLVAEIQQASNTTFRLFDWDRVGADGQPRPLHIEAALEVTDYQRGPVTPQTPTPQSGGWQQLVACDQFVLQRYQREEATALADDQRFKIVTVPQGAADLCWQGEIYPLLRGQSALIPAALEGITLRPRDAATTLLQMFLP